ncbi:2TM domain-containing protein [Rufibacter soli]
METEKDKILWKMAKKRVAFRRQLFTYLMVNLVVWAVWHFSNNGENFTVDGLPWPAWLTFGWGIGLAFNFYDAYYGFQDDATEREYEKLARRKKV